MPDEMNGGSRGSATCQSQARRGRRLERLAPASDGMAQLADLGARSARSAAGAPGGWSRFLVARLWWILLVTLVTVGGAAAFAWSQTPTYSSSAVVSVWFSAAEAAGAAQAPDMATEKGVVSSGVVLRIAATSMAMHHPSALLGGLSVSVPASTYLLVISYTDPNPSVARERAQAIARAYVEYRTAAPAAAGVFRTGRAPASPTATLITPASLPSSPSSPNYLADIAVALALGLGLGLGTAALRDHFDDRVRGPLDLAAQTGATVLALVPSFWSGRRTPASELVMVQDSGSVVAEAYRGLRTRVIQAAGAREAKTLLVTSPAWEDKGTAAANLAAALAQSGRITALACADMRWGRAHEAFGLENSVGLSQVLSGQVGLPEALRVTGVPRLRLLPPGEVPPDPAALLQCPAWRAVATELRQNADFVVIEAPPLLAASDAGPLAEVADMILVVADGRRSVRAQLRAASRELEPVRGKLIGWMLGNVGRRGWPRAARRALEPVRGALIGWMLGNVRKRRWPRAARRALGPVRGALIGWMPGVVGRRGWLRAARPAINQNPHVALAAQRRDHTESDD